tara:strand:+ start:46 stop:453 length:408 start_codon:yes stop_codon:yes gene_type:complete
MWQPFDHVAAGDLEFVLLYKTQGKSFSDTPKCEWRAMDQFGNRVGITSVGLVKLPVQGFEYGVPITEPVFFRERASQCIRMDLPDVLKDIKAYKTSGTAVERKLTRWEWNIEDLTIKNADETWSLRVFTPGGWWL